VIVECSRCKKKHCDNCEILAAYKWATGNPNAFGINGFIAGVNWARKQQPQQEVSE
jgi:hypothetical protein